MKCESFDYFVSKRKHAIKNDDGGIYGAVLPDPIPNSELKSARADDTAMHVVGKVGSRPLMI